MRTKRQFSAPHQKLVREAFQQNRKSKAIQLPPPDKQSNLKYDINALLSLFNQMDVSGKGEVSKHGIKRIMQIIGLYQLQHYLCFQSYTFDHFLSIIGEIQLPSDPSIYVVTFVKTLAHYRDKCIKNDDQGLYEAKEVQKKIKNISHNEIERQKNRLRVEHNKIFEQMQESQQKQFKIFEDQWTNYLKQFQDETSRKLQQTKYQKKAKLIEQQNKFLKKVQKTNVLTSPRLREMVQKKRWLIRQKRYDNAIQISNEISRQKQKLNDYKQQTNNQILTKKLGKLTTNTNKYIQAIQKNLEVNLNRLISKKKEGQNIMKVRMKSLRDEANRKLSEHFKGEIYRLRNSFYIAANH